MRTLLAVLCVVTTSLALAAQTYAPVSSSGELKRFVGKKIRVTGTVSNIPWQHLMAPSREFPENAYFDIGRDQIVIYSREEVKSHGPITVYGTVIEVVGGGKGHKSEERFTEYHINVDRWEPTGNVS